MTGNMQCEELSDRAGTTVRTGSGYTPGQVSFSALNGSVTSFQCRHAGPTESSGNVTPPSNASKGVCHTNLYSAMNPTSMKQGGLTLLTTHSATALPACIKAPTTSWLGFAMWGLCRSQQHLIVILAQGLAGQAPQHTGTFPLSSLVGRMVFSLERQTTTSLVSTRLT